MNEARNGAVSWRGRDHRAPSETAGASAPLYLGVAIWGVAVVPLVTAVLWLGVGFYLSPRSGPPTASVLEEPDEDGYGDMIYMVGPVLAEVALLFSLLGAGTAALSFPRAVARSRRWRRPVARPTIVFLVGSALLLVILHRGSFGLLRELLR